MKIIMKIGANIFAKKIIRKFYSKVFPGYLPKVTLGAIAEIAIPSDVDVKFTTTHENLVQLEISWKTHVKFR